MSDEKFELLSDVADSKNPEIVETYSEEELRGATIYYAYCDTEKRRIGNDTFDFRVASNLAKRHGRVYNHTTSVAKK